MPTTAFPDGTPTPMLALNRDEMPVGDGWTYEPKWDGFRTIVAIADDGVDLVSRTGRPLARYFPEVQALVGEVLGERRADPRRRDRDGPAGLDGLRDAAVAAAPGRLSREQARRRDPATLVLFDVLRVGTEDLTGSGLVDRRARLGALAGELGILEAVTSLADVPPDRRSRWRPGPTT